MNMKAEHAPCIADEGHALGQHSPCILQREGLANAVKSKRQSVNHVHVCKATLVEMRMTLRISMQPHTLPASLIAYVNCSR